mmetsp:Transcript_36409/g.74094  ORF Transcript_36409/g.74094 Transcript_36409/m.74094 type:complete len:601 (+) Transcript_36409:2213-4015(+)
MSSTKHGGVSGDARILPDTFPAKAYLMIESCDRDCSDVASWTDNGRAFVVRDMAKLASVQLPRYFKHQNFQSFVRQLNIYGFRKDAVAPGSESRDVVFRHEKFLRGEEDLLDLIQRAKRTTKKSAAAKRGSLAVGLASSVREGKPPASDISEPTLLSLQMQIAEMSAKIDMLLSIAATDESSTSSSTRSNVASAAASAAPVPAPAGKKRRHDGCAISDASDSDNDHDYDRQRSSSIAEMDVLEEEKTDALDRTDCEVASQESVDMLNASDDFTDLIDTVLGDEDILLDERTPSQQEDDDISALDDSQPQLSGDQSRLRGIDQEHETVIRSDEAATKVAPLPIEGEEQQYSAGNDGTVDAVITHAERVDHSDEDLENGMGSNDAPLAQAVPLTGDRHWTLRPLRGFRLVFVIVVILVLITFIVWPAVVFTSRSRAQKQKEAKRRPPPRDGPPRDRPPRGPPPEPVMEKFKEWLESEDIAEGGDGHGYGQDLGDGGSGNNGSGDNNYDVGVLSQEQGQHTAATAINETASMNVTFIEGQTDQVPPLDEKKLFVQAFVKQKVREKVREKAVSIFEEGKDSPIGSAHRISVDDILYQCTPVGQV